MEGVPLSEGRDALVNALWQPSENLTDQALA
jgi:hypothetical protein